MRLRTPIIALVTCLVGAAWGCGDGDTASDTTSSTTHSTATTTKKDAGAGGQTGGNEVCVTASGSVWASPTDNGTCDLVAIKKVPGCNHKECEACTVALNCLPVCCVCDDGKTQYAATGCLNKSGKLQDGLCMTADDVCLDENARTQGCANPAK